MQMAVRNDLFHLAAISVFMLPGGHNKLGLQTLTGTYSIHFAEVILS